MPILKRIGATRGTTTNVISIKSRKKPSINIVTITPITAPMTPPGIERSSSSIVSSPPKPLNTKLKNVAPIRIINTIEVILVVE